MPEFAINVIDQSGRRRSLRESAADEPALRDKLRSQGLWIVRLRTAKSPARLARLTVPLPEFLAFLHQLELLLRAGVTADAALLQLAEDAPAGPLRTMLARIHEQVAQGRPIHEACRFFARQFPPHIAAMIAGGEASAQLPESLRASRRTSRGPTNSGARPSARSSIPALCSPPRPADSLFLLGGVVPKFADIFASMRLTLPALTLALIA
jgi:type II secretory pathway component PulF